MYAKRNISDFIKNNKKISLNKVLVLFEKLRNANKNMPFIKCVIQKRNFFYDSYNNGLNYTVNDNGCLNLHDILFICFRNEIIQDKFLINGNLNLLYKIFKNNNIHINESYYPIMCNKKTMFSNLFELVRGCPIKLCGKDMFDTSKIKRVLKKNKINFKDEIILNNNLFIALVYKNENEFECIIGNESMRSLIYNICQDYQGKITEKDFNIININNLHEYNYLSNNAYFLYEKIHKQVYTREEATKRIIKYLTKIKYIENMNKIFNFPYRKKWINKLLYNPKYLKENGKYVVLD